MRKIPFATISTIAIAAIVMTACATGDPSASDSGETTSPAPAPGSPGAPSSPDTSAGRAPVGGGCTASPLTGDAAGALRIGMTVDDVRARCGVASDGTRPGPEGEPSRVIEVPMGADTVDAEIEDGRVWRIPVTSPRLRTADDLGVGTRLARLLELRDVQPAMGEGLYVLSPAHCGLSFQLDDPSGRPLPPAQTLAELRRLPETTVVSRVLVTGCDRG